MGFTLSELIRLRPYAFHSSCKRNFDAIRRRGKLRSTAEILSGTSYERLVSTRRISSAVLQIAGETVVVRDNKPLRPGSVELPEGYSLSDFLVELNSRVFFWPGTKRGPIDRGRSHFERYASEGPVSVIRVPLGSLVAANGGQGLFVTRCNSGSARHIQGKPVPRGPSTFQIPEAAPFTPGKVIELSYRGEARLPEDAEWSRSIKGPWQPLF